MRRYQWLLFSLVEFSSVIRYAFLQYRPPRQTRLGASLAGYTPLKPLHHIALPVPGQLYLVLCPLRTKLVFGYPGKREEVNHVVRSLMACFCYEEIWRPTSLLSTMASTSFSLSAQYALPLAIEVGIA